MGKQVQAHETSTGTLDPHAISMAVWDVPSPLVVNTAFKLKVGVKCGVGCNLAGEEVEIYDHEENRAATAILGGVPYSDSLDLYWAEVELTSPTTEGTYTWEAKLVNPSLELPHKEASHKFGFSAAKQPKNALTIQVVDEKTQAPVTHAHVMLRPYSAYTDEQGCAALEVADGEYKLYITKDAYETFLAIVPVVADTTLQAELEPAVFKEDYRGNLWKVERKITVREIKTCV